MAKPKNPYSTDAPAPAVSIQAAARDYLDTIATGKSAATVATYRQALNLFTQMLQKKRRLALDALVSDLEPKDLVRFAKYLENTPIIPGRPPKAVTKLHRKRKEAAKVRAKSSSQVNLIAVRQFLIHVHANGWNPDLSPTAVATLARSAIPTTGERLVTFSEKNVRMLIEWVDDPGFTALPHPAKMPASVYEKLRQDRLRNRAVVLTLADTGLRVSELSALDRRDIDYDERKAVIIGKGDKQAVIRFSSRSLKAIRDYHRARSRIDGAVGNLASQPVFCRHDRGAGRKAKRLGPNAVRTIIASLVKEKFGGGPDVHITPHTFRHYFVTQIVKQKGDIRKAQVMARHASIATTQRYSHYADKDIDQAYAEVFEGKGERPLPERLEDTPG